MTRTLKSSAPKAPEAFLAYSGSIFSCLSAPPPPGDVPAWGKHPNPDGTPLPLKVIGLCWVIGLYVIVSLFFVIAGRFGSSQSGRRIQLHSCSVVGEEITSGHHDSDRMRCGIVPKPP